MSKSERILLSYITIRGPDLEAIYAVVKENAKANFELLARLFCTPEKKGYGLETGQLRECLNFLRAVDILEINESMGNEEFKVAQGLRESSFPLLLLNKLRLAKDNSFYEVHKQLVQKDILQIDMDGLKRTIESSLDMGFTWTEEKLDFWMDMAQFLGLGRKTTVRRFVCFPSPNLIENLLSEFITSTGTGPVHLRDFIKYISSEFFECSTEQGQLFKGLQLTLLLLLKNGKVLLISAPSDDPHSVYIGDKPFSFISIKRG